MSSPIVDRVRGRSRLVRLRRSSARAGAAALVVAVTMALAACSGGVGEEGSAIDAGTTRSADPDPDADADADPDPDPVLVGTTTTEVDDGHQVEGVGGVDENAADVGGSATEPRCTTTDELAEPVRITVWHSLGGERTLDLFADLVGRFVDEHPGIEVELVNAGGYREALQRLRRADAGELPDLYMGAVDDARRLVDSGLFLAPVACRGFEPPVMADLLDVVRATLTFDDTMQAYPFNMSAPIMIYDRTLVASLGLDPDRPPATPEELREFLEVLVTSGRAPAGLALYDRSASWMVEQWAVSDGRVLVEPDNGAHGAVIDGVRFATAEAIDALTWLQRLADDGLVTWVGINESGIDDLLRLVDLSDRAAMTFHTSASLGELTFLVYEAGLPDLDDAELGVAPLPTPSGRPGTLVGGGALWLLDGGDPARLGAAASLAEHLLSPEVQAMFAAETGYVPATASAAASEITRRTWEQYPHFAVAYEQLVGLPASPVTAGMQIGPRVLVQRELEQAVASIVVFGRDPAEALAEAETSALEIIESYVAEFAAG